MNADALAGGRE